MHDAADVAPRAVQGEVRRRVRGRPRVAVDDRPRREVDDGDIGGGEPFVGHAARLDRHDAGRAIDRARIAEREDDQPGAPECQVRLEHPLPQVGVLHYSPPASR